MRALIKRYTELASALSDLPPLFFRLILAYGFLEPALQKLKNPADVAIWFGQMGIPFPTVNSYLAAATEGVGVVLLTLGLAVRFISVPLMFMMLVAITTVHLENGFPCGKNGFEIPFYYLAMLFSLVVTGAGRISLDYLMKKELS